MENLFSKPGGPELAYRYLLLAELNDDPEPLAAAALIKTLSGLGTTEYAVKRLAPASRFDPDYTDVLHGIHILETLVETETQAVA